MDRQYSKKKKKKTKKMKKRCAIPQKKLNELESILHQALSLLALPNPSNNNINHENRVRLLCDEIEQKSFFLHRLLKAEISSCPSPPTQEGHLIYIQNCFHRLHNAYHEWTENSDLTLLGNLGSEVGPEPECTASCFNTDQEEEEEEHELEELTESIISTQMSDNPLELEYLEDVVLPHAVEVEMEMVSVGVQTDDNLNDEIEEYKSSDHWFNKDTGEMIISETNENPVAEEFYEDIVEAGTEEDEEEEEEEEEEMVLVESMEKRKRKVPAKGVVVWMGSAMMMGFMIGRFYYSFVVDPAATYSNGCFDYYSIGGVHDHVFNMLPT